MQLHEAILVCDKAIKQWDKGLCEYPPIALVLPHLAYGKKTRLCKKKGPYCEWIAIVSEDRGTVAYFDARKVLNFLLPGPKETHP